MPVARTAAVAVASAVTLTALPLTLPADGPAVAGAAALPLADSSTTTRASTKLTLDATPDTLGKGEKTLVQGELFRASTYAPLPNRMIRLQSRRAWTSNAWVTYQTVTTDEQGHFHHYRFADRSREYRAVYTGSRVYQPATSNRLSTRVTLGRWTRVSAWMTSLNGKATVKGSLRRMSDGRVLPGQWIVIDRREPGRLAWTKIGSRRTGTNGYYSFTDVKRVSDCFSYRATFRGTTVFAGKSERALYRSC